MDKKNNFGYTVEEAIKLSTEEMEKLDQIFDNDDNDNNDNDDDDEDDYYKKTVLDCLFEDPVIEKFVNDEKKIRKEKAKQIRENGFKFKTKE